MRYFGIISYNGTRFCGWQSQPGSPTVQQTVETALSTILRVRTYVTGCGRTDTGVHAINYVFHFNYDGPMLDTSDMALSEYPFLNSNGQTPDEDQTLHDQPATLNWSHPTQETPLVPNQYLLSTIVPSPKLKEQLAMLVMKLNKFIGADIAFHHIIPVHEKAHARYHAISRSYRYFIDLEKNPFHTETAFFMPHNARMNLDKLQETADLLMQYQDFEPFCKSHTDVKTKICILTKAQWTLNQTDRQLVFDITANRFLRGMVRLIVGECLHVALGQSTLEQVKDCMDHQKMLPRATSVPPQGLFLKEIIYPFRISEE